MSDRHEHEPVDWKIHGVKIIPGDQLDPNTAQTPGMDRAAAINLARVGAQKIWAGTVKIHPNAKTGALIAASFAIALSESTCSIRPPR